MEIATFQCSSNINFACLFRVLIQGEIIKVKLENDRVIPWGYLLRLFSHYFPFGILSILLLEMNFYARNEFLRSCLS